MFMLHPNGVPMIFALSPTEKVTNYYSYFSPIPFGYGNWLPLITAILSIFTIVLLCISFKKRMKMAIEICLGIAIGASLLSWMVFGTYSVIGLIVLVLHILVFIMQLVKKRSAQSTQ